MDAQENKRVIMECYGLFQRGDIPGLLERCHDDAEWIERDSEHVPFTGCFHGKAEIAQFFDKYARDVETTRYVAKEFIADNDKVVVLGEASWVARPTGRAIDTPWVHVITMRDGKIARFESHLDTAAAERAFRPEPAGGMTGAIG
jgi:ketosteroid isomerase-like protein